jgi:hypothetical protein
LTFEIRAVYILRHCIMKNPKAPKRKGVCKTIEFPPEMFTKIKLRAEKNYSTFGAEVRRLSATGLKMIENVEKTFAP